MSGAATRRSREVLTIVDQVLRGARDGEADIPRGVAWTRLVCVMGLFGPIYGAVMGCWSLDSPERIWQAVYSAVKVPLLLGATMALCMPAFFVLSTIAGVRDDFRASVSAIIGGQAVMSVVLAALSPVTVVFYRSTEGYHVALMFNALMFGVGALAAQKAIRREYRSLIKRNRRHRTMLAMWFALYAFVGVQMGWTLRPFIGSPGARPTFFRDEPFTNAYVEVARIAASAARQAGLGSGSNEPGLRR